MAKYFGCNPNIGEYMSLTNADNWALWISTSSNCNGHDFLCGSSVSKGDCQTAASRYGNDTMYSQYTSHWFNSEYWEGCTAIFQCANEYPAGGISGAEIQDYFAEIYTSTAEGGAGCGICGSVYLKNGCEFTFNECDYLSYFEEELADENDIIPLDQITPQTSRPRPK
ncbi:hypothetical protein HO133_001565 [Letharia lupina]|uniref:Uncharacterized protein n=1 Tax=Letharia lupina TaxID=560253 RepID=A0A8H6FBE5_9LECA|nr:uncharacterized protein HO133_001565 [Letharia lupina]KAF6221599.1 hypothetical protein HO133_001565 [Letharia lupina]